ncbi:MAG TPA: dTDP-4-dehydrorhamnose 3,5-epimerase [Terriglobales bacterium]|jgi:dTDP-4-dehydrorhamnose 3,5-epimerase|nr:dTDP-4-dehydrorhamnose 3,5-epimerase [Terriglobales bacterium]
MKVTATEHPDVLIVEPRVFKDARGAFFEAYNQATFSKLGISNGFVQDNQSTSKKDVLRGLHYQIHQPQGKLIRVLGGEIFDVAVDCRRKSARFRQAVYVRLSAENRRMLWIPEGFAHGFLVLSDQAEVLYKTTDFYAPEHERTLLWNDPVLSIPWPTARPILSVKDQQGLPLSKAELFE